MNSNEPLSLDDFSKVLENKNLLDLHYGKWKRLSIRHGEGSLEHYDFKKHQQLRSLFADQRNIAGLYAYFLGQRCLYIGKSKNLQERIYQHFLESYRRWGHIRYQDFFSTNCGNLDLFILPLGASDRNGEYLRTIVEKILEVKYDPELKSIKL